VGKNFRRLLLLAADIIIVNAALYLGLIIRFEGEVPKVCMDVFFESVIPLTIIQIAVFFFFRFYSSLWQYASIDELLQIAFGTMTAALVSLAYGFFFDKMQSRTVYFIAWMLMFFACGGVRMGYRILRRYRHLGLTGFLRPKSRRRVMVVGAGYAGSVLIKELQDRHWTRVMPVVVIDDSVKKQNSRIHGIPVYGGKDKIDEATKKFGVDEIIIAIPSATKKEMQELISICAKTECRVRMLPSIEEFINGEVHLNKLRDVNIEDLLGRDEVKLNTDEICGYLKDEVVLVTGGGGSIGSELCRQIARFSPKQLLILDIYENNAYELQLELKRKYGDKLNLEVLIASVRDKGRMEYIFKTYKPGVVFHAAAHKHVPLMEVNPTEAIKNNVFGTLNTAECADKYGVKKFVLISTDKAVNPTNIMGASKRIAEMLIQSMSINSRTEFAAVRFGNVLGSNGSVVPLFKKQIEAGGPVTVTHKDITRYFMTITEAAQLVLEAGSMAKGGEIFILDMGEPVKILDLAENLIRLSGLVPNQDIKIEFTGLRPGEKLYEELLMAEEGLTATKHEKIFISKPISIDNEQMKEELDNLRRLMIGNCQEIGEHMERLVPTYNRASKTGTE